MGRPWSPTGHRPHEASAQAGLRSQPSIKGFLSPPRNEWDCEGRDIEEGEALSAARGSQGAISPRGQAVVPQHRGPELASDTKGHGATCTLPGSLPQAGSPSPTPPSRPLLNTGPRRRPHRQPDSKGGPVPAPPGTHSAGHPPQGCAPFIPHAQVTRWPAPTRGRPGSHLWEAHRKWTEIPESRGLPQCRRMEIGTEGEIKAKGPGRAQQG